jgi:threonine dehydrogenase-like Zn-dependent dehydrogenase
MDASFGTTPLAMQNAIRLQERGLVNTEKIITHKFALEKIHEGLEAMASPNSNKVCILP